jgi:hypothetical protein
MNEFGCGAADHPIIMQSLRWTRRKLGNQINRAGAIDWAGFQKHCVQCAFLSSRRVIVAATNFKGRTRRRTYAAGWFAKRQLDGNTGYLPSIATDIESVELFLDHLKS